MVVWRLSMRTFPKGGGIAPFVGVIVNNGERERVHALSYWKMTGDTRLTRRVLRSPLNAHSRAGVIWRTRSQDSSLCSSSTLKPSLRNENVTPKRWQ